MGQVFMGAALTLGGWVAGTATGCGTAHAGSGEQTSVTCKDGEAVLKASGTPEELAATWRAFAYPENRPGVAVQAIGLTATDGKLTVPCEGNGITPTLATVVFVAP